MRHILKQPPPLNLIIKYVFILNIVLYVSIVDSKQIFLSKHSKCQMSHRWFLLAAMPASLFAWIVSPVVQGSFIIENMANSLTSDLLKGGILGSRILDIFNRKSGHFVWKHINGHTSSQFMKINVTNHPILKGVRPIRA